MSILLIDNDITALPISLHTCSRLQNLHIGDAYKFVRPPVEITESGTAAILEYLADAAEGGGVLQQLRVVFVGTAQCGKTSLRKSLRHPDEPCMEKQDERTVGIDVETWQPQQDENAPVLYTYDFAGQDKYYPLQAPYLTRRSLYLVCWSGEGDIESGILRWISTLQSLAPGAVVQIVLTKCDKISVEERRRRVDEVREVVKRALDDMGVQAENRLKSLKEMRYSSSGTERYSLLERQYNELKKFPMPRVQRGILCTSCKDGIGLEHAVDEIMRRANDATLFPHMNEFLPRNYLEFHNWLDTQTVNRTTNYVAWNEVTRVLPAVNKTLVRFFHDLGRVLCWRVGAGDCVMFLRPQWLMERMKQLFVFEEMETERQHVPLKDMDAECEWRTGLDALRTGVLERHWLTYLCGWDNEICRNDLLMMMEETGVAFPLSERGDRNGRWLVPACAGSRADVKAPVDGYGDLTLRLRMGMGKFLPFGLYERLLVTLLRNYVKISDGRLAGTNWYVERDRGWIECGVDKSRLWIERSREGVGANSSAYIRIVWDISDNAAATVRHAMSERDRVALLVENVVAEHYPGIICQLETGPAAVGCPSYRKCRSMCKERRAWFYEDGALEGQRLPLLALDSTILRPRASSSVVSNVFLSYCWESQADALFIKAWLEGRVDKCQCCWLDLEQMGFSDNICDTVKAGVRRSAVFIPLLTPAYMESSNCRIEHEQAVKTHGGRGSMFPLLMEAMEGAYDVMYGNLVERRGWRQFLEETLKEKVSAAIAEHSADPSCGHSLEDVLAKLKMSQYLPNLQGLDLWNLHDAKEDEIAELEIPRLHARKLLRELTQTAGHVQSTVSTGGTHGEHFSVPSERESSGSKRRESDGDCDSAGRSKRQRQS